MWYYNIGVQATLTHEQEVNNILEFYEFFHEKGLTVESICGILGNIAQESQYNPANKQTSSTSSGWGLIQWTPSTVLTDWCELYGYNWYDGNAQCIRIWNEGIGEMGAGGVFYPAGGYNYSWSEFCQLTDINEAMYSYFYERERGVVETANFTYRLEQAQRCYRIITGEEPPTPPIPPKPKKNKYRKKFTFAPPIPFIY